MYPLLRRHFPRAMACPVSVVSSLPEWGMAMRQNEELRRYLLGLLDFDRFEGSVIGEMLDRKPFERMRDEYFHSDVCPPVQRPPWRGRLRARLSHHVARSLWASRALQRATRNMDNRPLSVEDTLRRIALLSLLQESLPELARVP